MDVKEFKKALDVLEKEKGIKEDVIYDALELALTSAYKKNYHSLLFLAFPLTIVQFSIETVLLYQLIMASLLYYVTVLHNKYYIGFAYRRKAVRYNKACSALHHSAECLLNLYLGSCVYA